MNLPTKLTLLRIVLIPVFVAVFFIPFPMHRFVALGVFVLCCATDFLDGYLARKLNQVTTLGKFLDPIADKMLIACALIAVAVMRVPATAALTEPVIQVIVVACAMIILCRELLISCFRIVAATKNIELAADNFGKVKTVFQMLALIALIPFVHMYQLTVSWSRNLGYIFYFTGLTWLALATVLTVFSGVNYIIKNKQVLIDNVKE